MSSEAQKKASNKYNKENTVQYCIRLNKKTDAEVIEVLDRCTNKAGYIKRLIINDIFQNNYWHIIIYWYNSKCQGDPWRSERKNHMNNYFYITVWSHANLDYKGYINKENEISTSAINLRIFRTIDQARETIENVKEEYKEHIDVLVFEIKSI